MQVAAAPARTAAPSSSGAAARRRPTRQAATAAARRGPPPCRAKVELQDLEGAMHVLDVPEGSNILDVALDEGLDLPYDCKMGVCLRCSAKVESGRVEQPGGMISEECQAAGYALMCVAYPQNDCKVRVIPEEELVDAVMEIA